MNDPAQIMRALILAQGGITALVSTRVYVDRLPNQPTFPAIVLQSKGGDVSDETPIQQAFFEVRFFANSHELARPSMVAMQTALHGKNRLTQGTNKIYYVGHESGPTTDVDQDTGWKYLGAVWRIDCST